MKKYLVTCTFYHSAMDAVNNTNLYEEQFVVECEPENIIIESYARLTHYNPMLKDHVLYRFKITNLFLL